MEEDEAPDPLPVGVLGVDGQVAEAADGADLFPERARPRRRIVPKHARMIRSYYPGVKRPITVA